GQELRALLVGERTRPETVVTGLGGLPWVVLQDLERAPRRRRLQALRSQVQLEKAPVLSVVLVAQASSALGDVRGAERVLRLALAARPDQVVLLNELGRLLEEQKRLAEATECHRAARTLRPNLGVALSRGLMATGRAPEAEAILRDLVRQQA